MLPFDQRSPLNALHSMRIQFIVQQQNTERPSQCSHLTKEIPAMHLKTLQCSTPKPIGALQPSLDVTISPNKSEPAVYIVLPCCILNCTVHCCRAFSIGLCTLHFALCTPPQSCAWRWWYSLILLWLALNFSLCSAFCQQWEILTICKVQVHKIYLSSLVQNAPTYELSDWAGTFSTGFHHQHNLEFSYIWWWCWGFL